MEASSHHGRADAAARQAAKDWVAFSESAAVVVARATDLRDSIQLVKTDLKASSGRTLANAERETRV